MKDGELQAMIEAKIAQDEYAGDVCIRCGAKCEPGYEAQVGLVCDDCLTEEESFQNWCRTGTY